MITPLDIQNKRFGKTLIGYSFDEVEEFLEDLFFDYERLFVENKDLRKELEGLKEDMKKYNELEETLKDTLVVAKATSKDMIQSAKEKSEIIIADSKLKSRAEIEKTQRNIEGMTRDIYRLKIEFNSMKNKYKTFLESQLVSINEITLCEDIKEKKNLKK